ncbi:phosphotransferase enzyme family protein [Ramlibacter solisilvae]|uniref:phosphotransferase enzyme family protein n=1 Tax=Ramlibacter tataouinensis TaxID=94132 RepID=UPI000A8944E2|nr:phosphotransferase [Ramlibacter tataouinensis]
MTSISIAQSTPTAAAIAAVVARHYAFGEAGECEFLRRSFNQVYGLRFGDGRRVVARLCAERPRGAPNTIYEAALLRHLRGRGIPVSACLPSAAGEDSVMVLLPEGERALMLFEYLEGDETGDAPEDIHAFGAGLAQLHDAASSYAGPPSRYALDLDYLVSRPLARTLQAPTMTDELRPQFQAIAARLRSRIEEMQGLTQVVCHGDSHGSNNFITADPHGRRVASFFDFDECGPGYLAYELAVYPWSLHPRSVDGQLSEKALDRWKRFLDAYRAVRPVAGQDVQALPAFISARQFWLMGEYAGRIPVWGSQAMPTSWLRRQVKMLTYWEEMTLPN